MNNILDLIKDVFLLKKLAGLGQLRELL